MKQHIEYLAQALELAHINRGFCAPNPAVGAIIVKTGKVLATGYHRGSGHAHAEIEALAQLSEAESQGATLYVTLEPCCHWGKTPPCTETLIKRGIKVVFYGFQDPNPQVAGKGMQRLQEAGIDCQRVFSAPIRDFYRSYAYWWQFKRPWVTAKLAVSSDGKIAGPGGSPVNITGTELQTFTHQWRKYSDAILTTAKTINADNPQLNVRLNGEIYRKSIYILDSQLSLMANAQIFTTAQRIIIFHKKAIDESKLKALQHAGANCVAVSADEQGLCLKEIMDFIGAEGVHDLWVEAGGRCFQALITKNLLHSSFIYKGKKYLGNDALSAFDNDFDVFATLKNSSWKKVGNDEVYETHWI